MIYPLTDYPVMHPTCPRAPMYSDDAQSCRAVRHTEICQNQQWTVYSPEPGAQSPEPGARSSEHRLSVTGVTHAHVQLVFLLQRSPRASSQSWAPFRRRCHATDADRV